MMISSPLMRTDHFFRREGKLGISESEKNDGIRFSEIVGSGFLFKNEGFSFSDEDEGDGDGDGNSNEWNETSIAEKRDEGDRSNDFQFLIKGLELSRRDAAALFFLVNFLSAAYGWVILGFLVVCILGVVFYAVVNNNLGKYNSFFGTIWTGSRLGFRRLSGFILMRWAVKDAMTQLLGLSFPLLKLYR